MQSLYDMILRPAQIAKLEFETNLDLTIFVSASVNPGALPLMAYTLEELYNKAKECNDFRLTFDDYNAIGGVEGAIGSRAEKTFRNLRKAAQDALPKVFHELVAVKKIGVATRKRVLLEKVKSSSGAEELVDALTEDRLLLTDREPVSNKPIVEVSHEALFSSWVRLRKWLEHVVGDLFVLQQIEEAVDIWKANGKNENYLWSGDRLKDAQATVRRLSLELRPDQEEFLQPAVERLEAKLLDDTLTHLKRESIGGKLLSIGDTRPGVGVRDDGLPDIKWCEVPDGVVQLEEKKGEFKVEHFYIAKYVVTHKQFQTFVDDPNGYECSQWWKNLAPQKFQVSMQPFRYDNDPRTNVNWFEAMAFCAWLTENLPCDALPKAEGTDWVVRLPTEWEWQQAASGGDTQRDYPWGNWCEEEIRCNDTQSGLERPTAVGMYPQGVSPVGALDMIGNVSEWCLNNYEVPRQIDLTSHERRSVRGCAWRFRAQSLNLRCRNFANPVNPAKHIGFRVVSAPRENAPCQ
ncbi:MAG: formylglycine-generating enzyme family protein [Symploca sp. SIO2G7]|nr:formylglycine-generating enzyme family protein [Symploca sp. SIO2G7]